MSAEVESAVHPSLEEDDLPGLNGTVGSDDDGDLFGDEDDDEADQTDNLHRRLDDSELDSGDDEARNDRVAATVEDEEAVYEEQKQLKLLDVDVARIKPPEGDELFLANIPEYLGIKHKAFDYATYEPPTKPHDGRDPSDANKFSPFSTANTSIFWRRDPQNPDNIQSNARIIRWSDGSYTLQIASKPTEQYRISTTAMRPGWPRRPPTSQQPGSQPQSQPQPEHYDPSRESNNFFGAPHSTPGMDLQIIAPFDASMKIQPTGDTADAAELKLRETIAATSRLNDTAENFKSVKVDPSRAKKEAEKAEKDVAKAARKRENAQERQFSRRDKVLGRGGLGGRSTGLTVGGLEDDMPTARGVKAKGRRRKTNRHGDILSDEDEDDEAYRRRGREDEYDREDDFLADSDEEPETYEDDDAEEPAEEDDDPDKDDLEIQGRRTVLEGRTRGGGRDRDRERTPKRQRDEDEEDAEAEDDPDTRRPAARRQRRVLDDEDEDE
ncbi:hypothetical protein H2200_006671 [Cladophialophora chaetospira]|uniref:RNA polymerase-associated protein LEO1 n=1 Tax=Cladophialophora chaetospira TaxID=386627 RepID=A0AA38X8U6_9EURO|nr:hypothetical protein H2200_006671 [Cladophialophora chaetospira]